MQDENLYKELEKMAKEKGIEIYKISAATGEGIEELLKHVSEILKTLPKEDVVEVVGGKKVYTLEDEIPFTITREDGMWIVDGPGVQKIMRRVNLEDNESMYYFQKCLDELGVNKALKEAGVKQGDTVKVVDWELEWMD
jgi:GTPase obg